MSNRNLTNLIQQLNILLKKNLYKDSLELIELNLKQNLTLDKNPDFLNIYGLIQLSLKDWKQAIKYFEKATEIDINFRPAYFNLGIAYYDLGKLTKAYESFCRVLEIDKNNKRAQENIIKILHCENIKNIKNDNLVDANNELQKLKFNLDLSKKITHVEILDILNNSNSVVSKFISDFSFREHQLLFHNQQDLNCERHFRIFRQFNTISNKCFSCYKIIIKLFDVYDLIRLSLIFNNFEFLDNFEMKCRVDLENKIYRGYIYCSSIADLDLVAKKIKAPLSINFENNYKLETRRGCSEYLKTVPDFKNIDNDPKKMFQYPKNWMKNEQLIDNQTYKDGMPIIRNAKKPLKGMTLNYFLIINNWINISKKLKNLNY